MLKSEERNRLLPILQEAASVRKSLDKVELQLAAVEYSVKQRVRYRQPKKTRISDCIYWPFVFIAFLIMIVVFYTNGVMDVPSAICCWGILFIAAVSSVWCIARRAMYAARCARYDQRYVKRCAKRASALDEADSHLSPKKQDTAKMCQQYVTLHTEMMRQNQRLQELYAMGDIPVDGRTAKRLSALYTALQKEKYNRKYRNIGSWYSEALRHSIQQEEKEEKKKAENAYDGYKYKHITETKYYERKCDEYYRQYTGQPPKDDDSISRALDDYERAHLEVFVHDIGGGSI